jgi:hypothetical protein
MQKIRLSGLVSIDCSQQETRIPCSLKPREFAGSSFTY